MLALDPSPVPRWVILTCAALAAARPAQAATIAVGPEDSYDKIEAAQAGDEVVIAPGTYRFRVHLTHQGTADQPIVIRAQDPAHPPVWDLAGTRVEDAPGSYGAGDRGRGCWQIAGGAHYRISGLVFTHCTNADANAAGLRYYAGAHHLLLSDCVFRENDNGLTGGTEDSEITVEFSEFDRNGNLQASAPTHNIYVYGGTFTLRYAYVHDPIQGQNFHVRAHSATLEYSWFARARSYAGDLMTDDDLAAGGSQSLLLRGNVLVQGSTQQNHGQIVAVYNDRGLPGMTMAVRLVHNTFVGDGGHAALVHLSNADGTTMAAELSNNVIAGTTVPVLVETPAAAAVTGTHNWLASGVAPGALQASVQTADPGFADAAAGDFTLAAGSPALGAASAAVGGLPDREYYRDEALARRYRLRASAHDLGAFEGTTTGDGLGPYDPAPGGGSGGGGGSPPAGGGCAAGGSGSAAALGLLTLALLAWRRRRKLLGR